MEPSKIERDRRIGELNQQIALHRAVRSRSDWDSLRRVRQAYVTNSQHLSNVLANPDSDSTILTALISEDQEGGFRQMYYDELFRSLHNYLAMITTSTDHARNLMKRYELTDFYVQYKDRVALLANLPLASFLKGLRNYLTHHDVPPLVMAFRVHRPESGPVFQVTLDSEKLLEWKGWKERAKLFLRSNNEIVLLDCVTEYTEQVSYLYDWISSQYETLHADDLYDVRRLQAELKDLLGA